MAGSFRAGSAFKLSAISGFTLAQGRKEQAPGNRPSGEKPGDPKGGKLMLSGALPDDLLLGPPLHRARRPVSKRQLHHLREVKAVAVGLLVDLLAATEAVGNDQLVVSRLAHLGQQGALAAL